MTINEDIKLFLPVLKIADLDKDDIFYADALDSCLKYLPKITGITFEFVAELSKFKNQETQKMVDLLIFTMSNLMYDKYDPDNPGHLFAAIQCFGGLWGSIAREHFSRVLRTKSKLIKASLDTKFRAVLPDSKVDEIALGILSLIAKCFGSAARCPLLPHVPFGAPPCPVSAFVDYLITVHPSLGRCREDLYKQVFDWHVPKYMRDNGVPTKSWNAANYVERLTLVVSHHAKKEN
jgi:hypothetical protein